MSEVDLQIGWCVDVVLLITPIGQPKIWSDGSAIDKHIEENDKEGDKESAGPRIAQKHTQLHLQRKEKQLLKPSSQYMMLGLMSRRVHCAV